MFLHFRMNQKNHLGSVINWLEIPNLNWNMKMIDWRWPLLRGRWNESWVFLTMECIFTHLMQCSMKTEQLKFINFGHHQTSKLWSSKTNNLFMQHIHRSDEGVWLSVYESNSTNITAVQPMLKNGRQSWQHWRITMQG